MPTSRVRPRTLGIRYGTSGSGEAPVLFPLFRFPTFPLVGVDLCRRRLGLLQDRLNACRIARTAGTTENTVTHGSAPRCKTTAHKARNMSAKNVSDDALER
eukprot:256366-Chlamydomonas_euryale.AAC.1